MILIILNLETYGVITKLLFLHDIIMFNFLNILSSDKGCWLNASPPTWSTR